jgi:hypothetical protein
MIAYEVEIKGLGEQLERLQAYDHVVDKHLRKAMFLSVNEVRKKVVPRTPQGVSGRLRGSIYAKTKGFGSAVIGEVGSSLREPYPAVMEFGRTPGKTAPPAHVLERWVHLKLRVPTSPRWRLRNAAFNVARKIGEEGIEGRKFMRGGFKDALPSIQKFFLYALQDIAREMSIGDN